MLLLPSTTNATAKGNSSREKYVICCSTPSSSTRKSSRLRSLTILPLSPRTVASTSTMLTFTLSVNPPFSGGGSWLPGAGPCALSSTQSANAQKARALDASARFIAHRRDSLDSSSSGRAPIRHQVVPRVSRGPAGSNTTLNFHYARRPGRRYTRHHPKCNCQLGFQYSALPATTEGTRSSSLVGSILPEADRSGHGSERQDALGALADGLP